MRSLFHLALALLTLSLATVCLFLMSGQASAEEITPPDVLTLSGSGHDRAHALAFSSDGRYLTVGGTAGIYLFDPQDSSLIEFIETGSWARSLAFLPDTHTLAAGLFDNTIGLWDVANTRFIKKLEGHHGWVRSIAVSGDGALIASASDDDTLRVWDVQAGAPSLVINEDTTGIRAVALSPDGRLVAGALGDNSVRVWNLADGSPLYTLSGHADWVRCLAFSPDGELLASGAFDKTILLWDMRDGSLVRTLAGHTSSVLGVTFSPDGKELASASVDQTVRVWQVPDGAPVHILPGHEDFVYAVAFSPDGETLASGAGDNTVRLWRLEELGDTLAEAAQADLNTPSDCRLCHHRRDTFEPARVIEISCEGCHSDGASLAWCANFPRTGAPESQPVAYSVTRDASGVPVNGQDISVVITSPSNGETLYVQGDHMAPEIISGKVFFPDPETISQVKVELQILSAGQNISGQATYPAPNGEFHFHADINQGAPPSQPVILLCRGCHENAGTGIRLPTGEVHIVVTATTPGGEQAVDERWIHVDASGTATVPVQVLDDITGEPIPGVMVQATTALYEWRARTQMAAADAQGSAQLRLESLSQAATTYRFSIPTQVVRGRSYGSDEQVELTLDPGESSYPAITMTAHTQAGKLSGKVSGERLPAVSERIKIWAFQLPAGPVLPASLTSSNAFTFDELPISQYLVFANPFTLASNGLSAEVETVDLGQSPYVTVTLAVTEASTFRGKVSARDGSARGGALPFAWVTVGNDRSAQPVNPLSGEFLLGNLPPDETFLTASAPGYYSLSQPISTEPGKLDFQLVPRPDMPRTQRIDWGDGELVVSSKSDLEIKDLSIALAQGWLWGSGRASQPLHIHLPGVEVTIPEGDFALEYPAGGNGWFYLYRGRAQMLYGANPRPVELGSGEMTSLSAGAGPIPIEEAVIAALHPTLNELPISEISEPTLRARLERELVKASIQAAQITTFITYMGAILALVGVPTLFFLRNKRKRIS